MKKTCIRWVLKTKRGAFREGWYDAGDHNVFATYATKEDALLDQAIGDTPVKARITVTCEELKRKAKP